MNYSNTLDSLHTEFESLIRPIWNLATNDRQTSNFQEWLTYLKLVINIQSLGKIAFLLDIRVPDCLMMDMLSSSVDKCKQPSSQGTSTKRKLESNLVEHNSSPNCKSRKIQLDNFENLKVKLDSNRKSIHHTEQVDLDCVSLNNDEDHYSQKESSVLVNPQLDRDLNEPMDSLNKNVEGEFEYID